MGGIFVGGIFVGGIFVGGIFGSRILYASNYKIINYFQTIFNMASKCFQKRRNFSFIVLIHEAIYIVSVNVSLPA